MNNSVEDNIKHWVNIISQRFSVHGSHAKIEKTELDEIAKIIKESSESNGGVVDSICKPLVDLMRTYAQIQKQKSAQSSTKPSQPSATAFKPEQLNLLRYQIMAFRYISKNMPIPAHVQQALGTLSTDKELVPPSSPSQMIVDVSVDKYQESKNGSDKEKIVDPYSHLKNVNRYSIHRLIIPSITPQGIDPIALSQERERRIRNRISYRIAELSSIPSNLSNGQEVDSSESNLKLKSMVELKSLSLLEKQKKLRADIITGMKNITLLQTAASRADYRRLKKPSLREIKYTEKMEKQHRMEREKKEKQKQIEYLNSIVQHGKEMVAVRKTLNQKQSKLGRAIISWHVNTEREEQKKKERLTKERIRALKMDDEEAYMKLIDKQKDTRLTHLLQQTNQYLDSLASLVAAQQDEIGRMDSAPVQLPEMDAPDEDGDKTDYYGIAHKIQEQITEQPNILVGGKLKEYQIKGLEWMVSLYNNKLNGILADEMGLGKTIQTISLVSHLIEKKKQNGPFLVIVPLSTITNWTLEFEKWAPSIVKVVYKGSPTQRRNIQLTEMRHNNFNVVLTTYEYIIKDKALLSKIKWIYTIIDEGHRMKNASSKLSVTLCQFYSSKYRLILTGTPLQNNLPELWALLNFVLPRIFNSVKTFDEWFNTPFANTGEKIELNEEEQLLIIKRLHKVLRPFLLRRLKKDVESDLPDKTERVLKTPLSAIQQKLYNQVRKSGAMMISSSSESGKKSGVRSINNTIMQLRKICNHPYVFPEVEDAVNPQSITDANIVRVSGKFELLDRILPKLKATGHRILIFFQMTAVMDIMEDYFRWRNFKYLRLDGSTKTEDRSVMLKQFNAPDSEYFVFILSTRAGGLGLNLQSADTVIIFDSDWNPHQDLQAQDRAHRIGQTKEVKIFRLITANSVEETILARAQYKLDIDGKVIQAGKFDNKSTNEERDTFLRSLFDGNPEDQNDINDVDDDDELNEIVARSEEEVEIFKRMDKEKAEEDLRYWRSLGRTGEPQRLMTVDELPEIYLHDVVPDQKVDITVDYGRGQRQRGDVVYADGLSDDRWAKAIDNEEDLDALVEKRRSRKTKRQSNKTNVGDEDEVSSNVSSSRRKSESVNDDDGGPRKKARTSSNQPNETLQNIMIACIEFVKNCSDNGRNQSELFTALPSKKDYPDYFQLIKKPISLDMIEERMNSLDYKSLADFRRDFYLMIQNAMTYNVEGSVVYADAQALKNAFDEKINSYDL